MGNWKIGSNDLTAGAGMDVGLGDYALRLYAQGNFIRWATSDGTHNVRLISPTLSGHFLPYRGAASDGTSTPTEGERGRAIDAAQARENAAAEQNEETMPVDVDALQNLSVTRSGRAVDNRWAAFLGLQVAEYQFRYNRYLSSRIGANIGVGLFRQVRTASTASVSGDNPIVTNRCSGPFSDAPGNGCETITLDHLTYPNLLLDEGGSRYAFGFQTNGYLDLLVVTPIPDSLPGFAIKLSLIIFDHKQTLNGYETTQTDNIYSRFAETPERPPVMFGVEYRFGAESKPVRVSSAPSTTTPSAGRTGAGATAKTKLGDGSPKRKGSTPPGGMPAAPGTPSPDTAALTARRSSWAPVKRR